MSIPLEALRAYVDNLPNNIRAYVFGIAHICAKNEKIHAALPDLIAGINPFTDLDQCTKMDVEFVVKYSGEYYPHVKLIAQASYQTLQLYALQR